MMANREDRIKHAPLPQPKIIVLMGVSGTGKSTLGTALSGTTHLPFIDGDDLHPPANVAKMARGEPLNDADRFPWLATIRDTAVACMRDQSGDGDERSRTGVEVDPGLLKQELDRVGISQGDPDEATGGVMDNGAWQPGVIVACSALKKAYRAVLRGEGTSERDGSSRWPTYMVYLKGEREVLEARMLARRGHFMKAGMLQSQLDTLESPEGEVGVVSVLVDMSVEEQVRTVVDTLRSWGAV